jgi:hypothetical protein
LLCGLMPSAGRDVDHQAASRLMIASRHLQR